MFILGHTGIAAGIVRAIDAKADLRRVALASLLPDLVDKPLWAIAPGFANGWTRLVALGLTGLTVFVVATLVALRGRVAEAWPLWLAYALHLCLDRMWEDGHILLWPFEGFWF